MQDDKFKMDFDKLFKQQQSFVQRTMIIYALASLVWFVLILSIILGAVYLFLRVCGVV